ncbi:MAG: Rab family GTPase [Promethearchaeota archaeon]
MTEGKKDIALAVIGEPGVGKTSLIRLLNKEIEGADKPITINSKDAVYVFWELQTSSFEPQRLEIFARSFIMNSKPFHRYLLIVTDSTMEDVTRVKYSLGFLRESFPDTRFAIVANKQDKSDSLGKTQIEKMTRLPTLEISAADTQNRSRLVNFLSYLLGSDASL